MASLSRVSARSAAATPSDHNAMFATGAHAATCKGGKPVASMKVASAGKKPGQLKYTSMCGSKTPPAMASAMPR